MPRVWMLMLVWVTTDSVKPMTRRTSKMEDTVNSHGDVAAFEDANLTGKSMAEAERNQLVKRLAELDDLIADSGDVGEGADEDENEVVDNSNSTQKEGDDKGENEVTGAPRKTITNMSSWGAFQNRDPPGAREADCQWACHDNPKNKDWCERYVFSTSDGGTCKLYDCEDELPTGYQCTYNCISYARAGKCGTPVSGWERDNCFARGHAPEANAKWEDMCKDSCGKCLCKDKLPDGYGCTWRCPNYAGADKCNTRSDFDRCFAKDNGNRNAIAVNAKWKDFCKASCTDANCIRL